MSAAADLTRWNRAGLTRFRYIDGNAATYLEELRSRLADAFGQWDALRGGVPPDESDSERIGRLLEQYEDDRRDLAWEIARSFARAAHVLAEHLDAYANEGYLGTAGQWENVPPPRGDARLPRRSPGVGIHNARSGIQNGGDRHG